MALKPIPVRFCAECGEPYHVTQPNKIYCDGTCRQAAWNRRITGGFKIYELAMRWRIDRPEGALSDMGAVVDQFAAEERIIRKRRQVNIERNRKGLPAGSVVDDVIPEFQPGKTTAAAVNLSSAQREALCAAGLYALSCAKGRVPNDPDARPEGWPPAKLKAIRDAMITLGGGSLIDEADLSP